MDSEPKNAPEIRQEKGKEILLAQLKQMPIVQIACQKSDVSRATYYRWRTEDDKFRKAADESIAEGEENITELSESELVLLIRARNFPAIQLWLRHHHPKYGNKVELSGNLKIEEEPLTPEQQKLVAKSLKLAGLEFGESSSENHEKLAQ